MLPLTGKTIVLGVTGGIAAYKACEVVSRLKKLGAGVFVVMTKNACEFVRPLTFETLSGNPVVSDTFARPLTWEVEHIALAKRADLFVIAPATANIMAKMAHGLADDMLSTTVLATRAPILLAPAMNTGMWENAATVENVRALKARGVFLVGPAGGLLACGDSGIGRMSEPADIVSGALALLLPARDLAGLNVLVTAGASREPLDPVRFLTNRSTGKMGFALAEEAAARGANVTLLAGATAIEPPRGVSLVPFTDTQSLYEAMLARCGDQDIIVQAAAPADFTPAETSPQKIKKDGRTDMTLTLRATPDIAKAVGERKREGQTLIGFAAETEQALENARKKLVKKNLDIIVANDVTAPGAGFGVDTNIVTLITAQDAVSLPVLPKREVAARIFDLALTLRGRA